MPAHVLFFYVLLLCSCGYALAKGGRPERQVAAMFIAATLLSKMAAWEVSGHFIDFEVGLFAIDLACSSASPPSRSLPTGIGRYG